MQVNVLCETARVIHISHIPPHKRMGNKQRLGPSFMSGCLSLIALQNRSLPPPRENKHLFPKVQGAPSRYKLGIGVRINIKTKKQKKF